MSEEQAVEEVKVEEPTSSENASSTSEPAPVETKTEQPTTDSDKKEKTEEPKHGDRFQKRIDKLTARNYALQAQLDQLATRVNGNQQQQVSQPKPDRRQFNDDSSYMEALTDFKLNERLPEVQRQATVHAQQSSAEQSFRAKEAQVRQEIPDYDEVIAENADIPIKHQAVLDAIVTSDLGPNLRYYLASHPDEANALNNMSSGTAARTIGRLELKLETELASKKKVEPKKQSQAPAPVKPVNAGGTTTGELDFNDAKAPIDDWMKKRREQKFARNKPLQRKT
jgi:hypothetical protein